MNVNTIEIDGTVMRMRVERWETRPATGFWNWLRRRKTITTKTLRGVYVVTGSMEIAHRLNAPDTFSASLRGTDALGALVLPPSVWNPPLG